MTQLLLAEFSSPARMIETARRSRGSQFRVAEAYTPYPLEELSGVLAQPASRIRPVMFAGGVLMAALAYGLEYYSAVVNYPYNSGGRPLDAWPAFMLVPFATGILLAAICGFIAFLREAGLPGLSNRLFAAEEFARASQDRFLLAVEFAQDDYDRDAAAHLLLDLGAISVREIE